MTLLSKHTYRIAVDNQKSIKYWTDYETGEPFYFPSGVSMQIQVGIREDKKTDTFYDVPAGTVLKLELKDPKKNGDPPDADDPAYMPQEFTVASLTSLSTADWQAGTSQHATFDYAAADTALPVGTYWMVISGVLSDGSLISPNFAKMEVVQDGTGPETTVAPVPPAEYDAATVDALLALKQDLNPIPLGVADPTVTGFAASLHTRGYTNETPARYFIKTGSGDTEWEQIFISTNGEFVSSVLIKHDTVAEIGTQVLKGGELALQNEEPFALIAGDGTRTGGIFVTEITQNVLIVSKNGTDSRSGLSPYSPANPFLTLTAAVSASAENDTIVVNAGDYTSESQVEVTKTLNINTNPGAILPNIRINTAGKTLSILGNGSISGITAQAGVLINEIDVNGFVTLSTDFLIRDCILKIPTNPAIGILNSSPMTAQFRNARIKATGTNADVLEFDDFTYGSLKVVIENSILEANGTGLGIVAGGSGGLNPLPVDIMNVYANAGLTGVTENIQSVTVNSLVTAII